MENLLNKKKVLVIDDDINLNSALINKMNLSGLDAVGASGGIEGLEKAFKFKPDLILLDVIMPNIDGFQVLEKLRLDPWGKQAKVIMLTAVDKMDAISKAVDSNVAGYFVKTNYSLEGLVQEVQKILGIKK